MAASLSILRDPLMQALTRWQARARARAALTKEYAALTTRLLRAHHGPHGGNVFRCPDDVCQTALALIGRTYDRDDVRGRLAASVELVGGES